MGDPDPSLGVLADPEVNWAYGVLASYEQLGLGAYVVDGKAPEDACYALEILTEKLGHAASECQDTKRREILQGLANNYAHVQHIISALSALRRPR